LKVAAQSKHIKKNKKASSSEEDSDKSDSDSDSDSDVKPALIGKRPVVA
jgi:hypothetical protein